MKGNILTVRLSKQEKEKLQRAAEERAMSISQYTRQMLTGERISVVSNSKEIMAQVGKIYKKIAELGRMDNDELKEEVNGICKLLQKKEAHI